MMSSIALKLPNSYVEIEKYEMEYVDGGAKKVDYWWGYAIDLSPSECGATAELLGVNLGGAVATGSLAALFGGPFAVPVEAAAIIYAVGVTYAMSVLKACAANGNGATLSKTKLGYSVNPW